MPHEDFFMTWRRVPRTPSLYQRECPKFMAEESSIAACSGSIYQNLIRARNNIAEVSRFHAVQVACLLLSWVQSTAAGKVGSHDGFS